MPENFYRFHSTHALLDGDRELESQEIYLCSHHVSKDPSTLPPRMLTGCGDDAQASLGFL
jgi:hypothetical protein